MFLLSLVLFLQVTGRRMSTSDSGVEMSVSPHSRSLPTSQVVSSYQTQQTPRHPETFPEDDPSLYRGELDGVMKQYQRQQNIYQMVNKCFLFERIHSVYVLCTIYI